MAPARRATQQNRGVVRRALARYRLLADNRRLQTVARQRLQSGRILNSAPEGIVGLDVEGRITFANPAAAGMMGYTVEELRGQPIRTHMQFSGASTALDLEGQLAGHLPHGEEA